MAVQTICTAFFLVIVKKWFIRASILVATLGLLYLALRKMDMGVVLEQLRQGDYRWLPPMIVIVFVAHWIRAWRWKLLLDATGTHTPVHVSKSFGAILVGYMINFVTPRAGEIARSFVLARTEDRSFLSTMGTVVADRALDILSVLLALVSVIVILRQKLDVFIDTFVRPVIVQALANKTFTVLIIAGLVVLIVAAIYYVRSGRFKKASSLGLFADGLASVVKTGRPYAIVISTCLIWLCYTMMAYLPMKMYAIDVTYQLSILDAWCIMIIGSIAFAFPSPGGIGSFHFVTILALSSLYGVANETAGTYALVAHGIQLILYVLSGAIAAALMGLGYGTLRSNLDGKGNSGSP